jgi:hypothetical protein
LVPRNALVSSERSLFTRLARNGLVGSSGRMVGYLEVSWRKIAITLVDP